MSVTIGTTDNCCRTVQQGLAMVAGSQNITTYRIDRPGMLDALTSGVNTAGTQAIDIDDPTSKNRIVKVRYWQNPRTAAASTAPNICAFGTSVGEKYATVAVNKTRSVELTLKDDEFRDFCAALSGADTIAQTDFAMQQIAAKMNQLVKYIDRDAVGEIYANAGNFRDGTSTAKDVTLTSAVNGVYAPQYKGELDMLNAFEDIESEGKPIVVGSGLWREYTKLKNIACCNEAGVDLSLVGDDFYYYRDPYVDTAASDNNIGIAWAPGSAQIFFRTYFRPPFSHTSSDKQKGVVTMDYNGTSIPLDFTAYYDYCGDSNNGRDSKWVLTWTASFGMFYLPSDLEAVGTDFEGVNNILLFKGNCGPVTCDTNS